MCSKEKEQQLEQQGCKIVIGIDEAGAGCLAGPVTVCACYIPLHVEIKGINDSKKLSEKKRNDLYQKLVNNPEVKYDIIHIDNNTIDTINILQARFLGMFQSYKKLQASMNNNESPTIIDGILIDGNQIPPQFKDLKEEEKTKLQIETIIGGDAKCYCIAAASIIAKVSRDRLMCEYDELYPGYEFSKNKGYGTKKHFEDLKKLGPTSIHRKTFRGVL
jgi:ribonuclease HII